MAVVFFMPACGNPVTGSSSGSGTSGSGTWQQGVFAPSSSFAAQCATPRTGNDPTTGRAFPDKPGSTLTENNFLRSWTNELYLWYREVQDVNPANSSTADYFNLLKTTATTPSGNPKDKFHFTYATSDWEQLSQSGVSAGYGATWIVVSSRPPRNVVVGFSDPGTPASAANLARGAQVLVVDGVDLVNAGDQNSVNVLNEALFPTATGQSHTFTVIDLGSSSPRTFSMVATSVTETPVQNVETVRTSSGLVGYMLFNDHIATAEPLLISAFGQLQDAGVSDLVLDIRYNGGGYLDMASEVAYMIAGPGATTGKTFEKAAFNDKYPTNNPVTGRALTPVPFHSTSQGLSGPEGQALPALSLSRVFLLTGPDTCSASEAIINGLRGVNVSVIQIGSTTCGKPYGFYPQDNCGTTYFSIEFQGVNAQGFGDYPDGFSPANTASGGGVPLPGCSVADDFGHALGDPSEARFDAALGYRETQGCPAASGVAPRPAVSEGSAVGLIPKSPWRTNRILRRRSS